MYFCYRPTLLALSLATVLTACNSSDIAENTVETGNIAIPDVQRDALSSLPSIAFNGEYQTTASPERGISDSDASIGVEDGVLATVSSPDTAGDSIRAGVSDRVIIEPGIPGPTITPGTLTAGDYDDHLNPHLYNDYAARYLQNRGQWIDTPRLDFSKRVLIRVSNTSARPLADAKVEIISSESQAITTLYTAANGETSVYTNLDSIPETFTLRVTASDGTAEQKEISLQQASAAGEIHVTLDISDRSDSIPVDVMFVVDTTGSMSDELSFLQTELTDIIGALPQQQSDINVGLVFYRDYGDTYVTRAYDFSEDLNSSQLNLNQESAAGGGDYPEAMDQALEAALRADWRENSRKLLFLLADAPPHSDRIRATWNAASAARKNNIHLVPVAASGVAEDAEYIMRSIAALTNGRYIFLTDDSGYGLAHDEPDVDCYVVTSLRHAMMRAMASLVTGNRVEPTDSEIIRRVGNYDNGKCSREEPSVTQVDYSLLAVRVSLANGEFTTRQTQIIENQNSFDQALANYGESSIDVDFSSHKVLLADMGQKNTGGYRIEIGSVEDRGDYVQAHVIYNNPGPLCGVTQALTNPYVFVQINTQKEIRIVETNRERGCS